MPVTGDISDKAVVVWLDDGNTLGAFTQSIAVLAVHSTFSGSLDAAPTRLQWGPQLDTGRNRFVDKFIDQTDAGWMLMIDSDMRFDPDVLDRLLATARATPTLNGMPPITSGLTWLYDQEKGQLPSAVRRDPDTGLPMNLVPSDFSEPGEILDVDGTGAACLLVHRDVYLDLGRNPFDRIKIDDIWVSEDYSFGLKARDAGHRIIVDTGVTFDHGKLQFMTRESYDSQAVRVVDNSEEPLIGPVEVVA